MTGAGRISVRPRSPAGAPANCLINKLALDKLQALRDRLGKPLIVRSAYRSPEHNRAVGGAAYSKHLDSAAFDIAMANHDPVAFESVARDVGFLGFGFYPRSGFMHVDLGPARQWGERFPARSVPFAAETPPAREVLAQSRTMKRAAARQAWRRWVRRRRGGAAGSGGDADCHPAARPVSRYAPLGVHSPSRLGASQSRSTPASMTGAGGGGDRWAPRHARRIRHGRARRSATASQPFRSFCFLLALRRSGERAGRLAEQLETTERIHDAQRRMLEAAARRPRVSRRSGLSGCATDASDVGSLGACPPVVEYSPEFQARGLRSWPCCRRDRQSQRC